MTAAELEKLQAESNKLKAEYLEIAKSYDRTTDTYKRIAATYGEANRKYLDAIAATQRSTALWTKASEDSKAAADGWNAVFWLVLGTAAIAACCRRR
jgi:hypothetical protein